MEYLNQIIEYIVGSEATAILVSQIFVVVLSTLVINFLLKRIVKKLQLKVERTTQLWDDALLYALYPPASILIWLTGLSFAADIVASQSDAVIFSAVGPIRELGIIATIAWFLIRLIQMVEQNYIFVGQQEESNYDPTTAEAIAKLFRLAVVITAALVALQTLGFSISGVLAFGGVGGIAIGFAAKDLLANFFGGLMIYLDRPFKIGDWIKSPDRDIEGTVEKIGWRLTVIRTFDKRPLYLPNSTFSSIAVINPSRMSHRRIYETIGVRYDDLKRVSIIIDRVKSMLENHPEIDSEQTLIVNFNQFAASSLDFFIYTFTKTTNWVHFHAVKQDVLLNVAEIIEDAGAEIAFPTSTIHLASEHPHELDAVSPKV
ncbi:MAG: mechanosensitive ion channel family protein [Gammaproteobacteria bacterium]|nr:mechanosensitive ion channel family protein [Gammaproteobacteria bacterium]